MPSHLEFGPLDPSDAPHRVPPGQLGTIDQLGLRELVRSGGCDFLLDLLPSRRLSGAVGPETKQGSAFTSKSRNFATIRLGSGHARLYAPAKFGERRFNSWRRSSEIRKNMGLQERLS